MSSYDPPTDDSTPFDYDPASGTRDEDDLPLTCCWCSGPRGDDYTPLKRDGRWYAICRPCRETRDAQAELELRADSETAQPKDGTLVVERQQSLMVREEHAIAPVEQADSLIAVIARAAQDPTVDVEKMERLLALKQKIDEDNRKIAYQGALARVQKNVPHVNKHGRVEIRKEGKIVGSSKYALLEDIDRVVRPMLAEEGFSLSFDAQTVEGKIRVVGKLSHEAGHFEEKEVTLPADVSGFKNPVQAVGSTLSYARRMLIKMFLNLIEVDEDDDGHGGSEPLNQDQRNTIINLMNTTHTDERRFLQFMNVEKVEAILKRDYKRAYDALKDKERRAI